MCSECQKKMLSKLVLENVGKDHVLTVLMSHSSPIPAQTMKRPCMQKKSCGTAVSWGKVFKLRLKGACEILALIISGQKSWKMFKTIYWLSTVVNICKYDINISHKQNHHKAFSDPPLHSAPFGSLVAACFPTGWNYSTSLLATGERHKWC